MGDWIEWKGGERPVDDMAEVVVKFRSGQECAAVAGGMWWRHLFDSESGSGGGDIIAYRLAEPKAEPQAHMMSAPDMGLRAKLDAQDAEIARLTAALKRANDQAEHFEREWYLRGDELEQLRKASDGPMGTGHDVRGGLLNRIHDHALDHRLGIALPEGEPCEPRPAGARWRAMV
jgi:hypothetical protein